jgi:hypothetical protein
VSKQTPTPAAMRAAKELAIAASQNLNGCIPPVDAVAAIIDRETGLPELIEACQSLAGSIEGIGAIRAQLAKSEGRPQ